MPLRSPKMNRFIFGFHRRVWWPKWTPASNSCFMLTTAIAVPPPVVWPGRAHRLATVTVSATGGQVSAPAGCRRPEQCSPEGSAPRVGPFVDLEEPFLGDVRVDLGGLEAGVTEHLL